MARVPNPTRHDELLAQIVDHLGDSSLADLSFRTLARSLNVSTYALVYHFGTREELIGEIVHAIAVRQKGTVPTDREQPDLDHHLQQIRAAFAWQLLPENIKLQRLEFEAAMLEALDPTLHTYTRGTFRFWMDETQRTLVAFGLSPEDAAIEARILNNLFYGFQYDLVINGDTVAATEGFSLAMDRYREHLQSLIELAL